MTPEPPAPRHDLHVVTITAVIDEAIEPDMTRLCDDAFRPFAAQGINPVFYRGQVGPYDERLQMSYECPPHVCWQTARRELAERVMDPKENER